MSPSPTPPRHIVIIGGGIIGCCTAYFLTRHPLFSTPSHNISITILESNAIASGASGKAGGLLAKWAYPAELVDLSWRLHGELAKEHGGRERWGYRRVDVGEVGLRGMEAETGDGQGISLQKRKSDPTTTKPRYRDVTLPASLDFFHQPSLRSYTSMGSTEDTAQVHPYQFTTSMAELAVERGVKLVIGSGVEMLRDEEGRVRGVRYRMKDSQEENVLEATDVVIAAGPWSGGPGLCPTSGIGGLRAHSVVVRPTREVGPWAVFSRIEEGGKNSTPEIYTRPDGTVYMCGAGDTDVPLPDGGTEDVAVDEGRCEEILSAVRGVSDVLGKGGVVVRQACYLPVVESGEGPLIGRLGEGEGEWLAAGHSCWGIMNGPATGLLMSELILDGKTTSADIEGLDPRNVVTV